MFNSAIRMTVRNADKSGVMDVIFPCIDAFVNDEADLVLTLADGKRATFYVPFHGYHPTTSSDLLLAERRAGVIHYNEDEVEAC